MASAMPGADWAAGPAGTAAMRWLSAAAALLEEEAAAQVTPLESQWVAAAAAVTLRLSEVATATAAGSDLGPAAAAPIRGPQAGVVLVTAPAMEGWMMAAAAG